MGGSINIGEEVRVLMLETSGWGGICHYTHCLSQALAGEGVSLTLVTNEVFELRNLERRYGVLPVLRDGGSYMERMRQFLRALVSESPDILHIQSGFSARRDWVMSPLFRKHGGSFSLLTTLSHESGEKSGGDGFCPRQNLQPATDRRPFMRIQEMLRRHRNRSTGAVIPTEPSSLQFGRQ
jgi:hypothetical protein